MILERKNLFRITRKISFVLVFLFNISGCGSGIDGTTAAFEKAEEVEDSSEEYTYEMDSTEAIKKLDDYKVTLDVTNNIKLHKKGNLRVWIGLEELIPELGEDMVRDVTTIPSKIGGYAKITPYAPDFKVQPEKSKCIRIHSSGSSVLFTLIPLKQGDFKVSANVELYEEFNCSGTPIPKSSESLTVIVTVDKAEVFQVKMRELLTILWDKFLSFWGVVITLLFGLIIYLIKKYLKKKTGYNEMD